MNGFMLTRGNGQIRQASIITVVSGIPGALLTVVSVFRCSSIAKRSASSLRTRSAASIKRNRVAWECDG